MIESTSSCTKASGSNPNFLVANCSIDLRKGAPGMSACFPSHASSRRAMSFACGMPPMPAGWSITRLLSVMANWPSRKKASRGVVAIQFGLPRPALRNADCVVRDVFLARLISSSLISKGLKASNFLRVRMSAMTYSWLQPCSDLGKDDQGVPNFVVRQCVFRRGALAQHHHQHHAPDRQQGVADGVGDRVAKPGNLALGAII